MPISRLLKINNIGGFGMDYKKYCQNQADAAKRYRSTMNPDNSEELNQDAIIEWVEKYAKEYRENYEKAYECIIHRVTSKAKRLIKEKLPNIGDNELETMAKIILDQFTDIWTIEMSKDDHDEHIEEI
jgi:hypothetical protein